MIKTVTIKACGRPEILRKTLQSIVRDKGEFYVCPVFNEAIESGLRIGIFDVDRMAVLGTPEDLESFLDNFE